MSTEAKSQYKEFTIKSGNTSAIVSPMRGGIVTSFQVNGEEVLFLDRDTFNDKDKNVRGGIPILFPNAGPLEDGPFNLDQHGFVRKMPWILTGKTSDSVLITLVSNRKTRSKYPYDFRLDLRVSVAPGGRLIHGMTITNTGSEVMPTAYGIHPYFLIPETEKSKLYTNIDSFKSSDVNWKDEYDKSFENCGNVELHLPASLSSLSRRLRITSNPNLFKNLYIWSLPERDFVCVEPWTRKDNALNTLDALLIEPNRSVFLPVSITANVGTKNY